MLQQKKQPLIFNKNLGILFIYLVSQLFCLSGHCFNCILLHCIFLRHYRFRITTSTCNSNLFVQHQQGDDYKQMFCSSGFAFSMFSFSDNIDWIPNQAIEQASILSWQSSDLALKDVMVQVRVYNQVQYIQPSIFYMPHLAKLLNNSGMCTNILCT